MSRSGTDGETRGAAVAPARFDTVAIVGIGLIGSSLARAMRARGLAGRIVCCDSDPVHRERALALGIVDAATGDPAEAVAGAGIIVLCTPLGTYEGLARAMAPGLAPGQIVTDVGSVKGSAVAALAPHLPAGVHLVPGHPVAGTEHSGPDAGFAELFEDRWCIVTPPEGADPDAVAAVVGLWRAVGMRVEVMDIDHHDRVLAMTSHLPHLIAYCIVGTATELEADLQAEVIKFSAGGFRDFTRIAGSNPVMWRDVFLDNREAVLEMLGRFEEDLTALRRMVRRGDGPALEALFDRTRTIRRGIVEAGQHKFEPDKVRDRDGGQGSG